MALAVEFIVLEGKSVISNQTYFKAFKQRFLKELDSDNDDTERQREAMRLVQAITREQDKGTSQFALDHKGS